MLFSLIIIILFTSCTTKELWSNASYHTPIEKFLISEDKKTLVVVGDKYHYIFPLDNNLKEILLSNKRKLLKVFFQSFKISSNNTIAGSYILYYDTKGNIKDNNIEWFKKRNFTESSNNSIFSYNISYIKIGSLKGTRYLANKTISTNNKFIKKYCIKIEEDYYKYDENTRIKNTPVTVTVDGIATIALISLIALTGQVPVGGGDNYDDLKSVNKKLICSKKGKKDSPFFLLF